MSSLPPVRLLLALALVCGAAFMGWAGGPLNPVDQRIVVALMDIRVASSGLTSAAIAATWLGSAYVTLGGTLAGAAWRWFADDRRCAAWLVLTVGGGRLLADGLKLVVDRPRPHFMPYPVPVSSLSFPSGHAANSMIAFGALALAFATKRWRTTAIAIAICSSIAIGLTRPYLGVHWPSDVVGGWLIGGAVLLIAGPFRTRGAQTEA